MSIGEIPSGGRRFPHPIKSAECAWHVWCGSRLLPEGQLKCKYFVFRLKLFSGFMKNQTLAKGQYVLVGKVSTTCVIVCVICVKCVVHTVTEEGSYRTRKFWPKTGCLPTFKIFSIDQDCKKQHTEHYRHPHNRDFHRLY